MFLPIFCHEILLSATQRHTHTCAGTNKKTTDRERSGERC